LKGKKKKLSGDLIREKNVAKFALKTSDTAFNKALSTKATIVIARDGKIVTKFADGSEKSGRTYQRK
jgi:hypothetical protein